MNRTLNTRPATRWLYLCLLAVTFFAALTPTAQAQQSFVATCAVRHNRADFDGDCKTDISTFNRSTGYWNVLNSTNNQVVSSQFGQSGDIPTPGDYDGDSKADIAVQRPGDGAWHVVRSSTSVYYSVYFVSPEFPVPGAYLTPLY